VASDIIDTPAGSKPRTKPLKHAQACVHCSRSKVRCDGGRPCGRCVKRGLSDACRRRQSTSDCGVALVGAGGEEERNPHKLRKRALQSEWQDDFQLRANGLGINGLSSAGAAIPQQSAVVGLLSQGSATFARDESAAAGWSGVESGAGVAGGGLRLPSLPLPLPQQHLGAGGNAGRTSALPLLWGEKHLPLSQTLLGMDSGVLPATLAPPRMGLFQEPVLQPIRSPFETSQAPLASDRNLGLFSPGNSSSNRGAISDFLSNSPKVRSTADAPPTPCIPSLFGLGSSSSSLASCSSLFSVADAPSNLGLCSRGNSSSRLEGGGMGVAGAQPVCAHQEGSALPVPMNGRRFDMGSHSEPSQLRPWATLVEKSSLLASLDQSQGAGQGSRRCIAVSDLYSDSDSDSGKNDADASAADASAADARGADASAPGSGALIVEVAALFFSYCRSRRHFPCDA